MKKIFVGILLLLVLGGVYFVSNTPRPTVSEQQQEKDEQQITSIPDGWQTYKDTEHSFQISYPDDFTVSQNGENSIMLVRKVTEPGQGPTNFVYISVVPEDKRNAEGVIYNYNKTHIDSLLSMEVNDEKPLAGESPDLEEWITYKRLPDTSLSGYTAKAFVNDKPWEFPLGTREYRYIIEEGKFMYIIGGYIGTTSHNQYTIAEDLFRQILATIQLPQ